tara:strand:- start:1789 stop:2079 length:291 start_codon:yes stop_codon:yes gene_type:complete
MKFTKEIKEKWLKAMKSGQYKQGFGKLYDEGNNTYCALGVLDKVLNMKLGDSYNYSFSNKIWGANDNRKYKFFGIFGLKTDYSNVIPVIEQLPTED